MGESFRVVQHADHPEMIALPARLRSRSRVKHHRHTTARTIQHGDLGIDDQIAGANLAVTALASFLLYEPYGVAGIVAATAIATTISVIAQVVLLRTRLGGIEATRFISTTARVAVGSAVLAGVSYESWSLLDEALGRQLLGQIVAVSVALGLGGVAYLACSRLLRIPELDQILALARRR